MISLRAKRDSPTRFPSVNGEDPKSSSLPQMNISEIQNLLNHADSTRRQKGILALKDHDAETAIPLLLSRKDDPEFLVRSFVAMGLGRKQSADAFSALLGMMESDRDANVQAEAANSLSLYGKISVTPLVRAFYNTNNWLVRRSILAAMLDLDAPAELLNICLEATKDDDMTVVQAALDVVSTLVGTEQEDTALETVLAFANDANWRTRMQVAYSLKRFNREAARQALITLRQDSHHKVVAAALEGLLPR
ncbi:MAG: HEAT repeat domain-containing protein [Cyanobacteria bacterium J06632_22]